MRGVHGVPHVAAVRSISSPDLAFIAAIPAFSVRVQDPHARLRTGGERSSWIWPVASSYLLIEGVMITPHPKNALRLSAKTRVQTIRARNPTR